MADPDDMAPEDIRQALAHATARRPIPWDFVDGLLDELLVADPHLCDVDIFEHD